MTRRLLVLLGILLAILLVPGPHALAGGGDEGGDGSGNGDEVETEGEGEPGDGGDGGEGGPDGEPGAAAADSARAAAQAARTRFKPNYRSTYEINRNTNTWTQSFSVSSWAGPVDITNSTRIAIGEDTTLDRDRRNRNSNFGFAYNMRNGVRINSTLALTRNETVDAGVTDTSQETENLNVEATYQRTLMTDLDGDFRVAAGASHDKRDDPLTSNRESFGPQMEASGNFTLKRLADWSIQSSIRSSYLESTESVTDQTTQDKNLIGNLGMNVEFQTPYFDNWNLSVGTSINRNQYPFLVNEMQPDSSVIEIARQETNKNIGRDVSLSAGMSPRPRLNLSGQVSYRNNDVNRVLDTERSQESIDHAAGGRLDYLFSDSTRVETRYDWAKARSLFDAVDRMVLNGDIETRGIGGSVRRPLGSKARIDMAGNYELQSYLFDDTEENHDDRDVVRGDFSARIDYVPAAKVETNIRFTLQHNQTVFIDASRSANNQTQQVYSIYPMLEYQITPMVTFREEGAVLANSTVFDFEENENRDRLSRTTELRSTIDAQVHPRVGINLRHSYRFLQDGSYRRGDDGVRRFGKSSEDTSQDLTFRVDYRPLRGGSVFFRTYRRDSKTTSFQPRGGEIAEISSDRKFTEIEAGSRLDRSLRMGLRIGVDIRRLQSWTSNDVRNNYWVGSVEIGYQF